MGCQTQARPAPASVPGKQAGPGRGTKGLKVPIYSHWGEQRALLQGGLQAWQPGPGVGVASRVDFGEGWQSEGQLDWGKAFASAVRPQGVFVD